MSPHTPLSPTKPLTPPEHARRLQQWGVKQQSLYYYTSKGLAVRSNEGLLLLAPPEEAVLRPLAPEEAHCAAYTAAELEAALPPMVEGIALVTDNSGAIKYVSYPGLKTTFGATEAQALANMLLWLLERKYVGVREVNGRM
ncbi:MAG TPA: hypothetical protein VGE66_02635 [Chitinophagaceae bacterium]